METASASSRCRFSDVCQRDSQVVSVDRPAPLSVDRCSGGIMLSRLSAVDRICSTTCASSRRGSSLPPDSSAAARSSVESAPPSTRAGITSGESSSSPSPRRHLATSRPRDHQHDRVVQPAASAASKPSRASSWSALAPAEQLPAGHQHPRRVLGRRLLDRVRRGAGRHQNLHPHHTDEMVSTLQTGAARGSRTAARYSPALPVTAPGSRRARATRRSAPPERLSHQARVAALLSGCQPTRSGHPAAEPPGLTTALSFDRRSTCGTMARNVQAHGA